MLDQQYRLQRDELEKSLLDAREAADQLRHDLLYGRGEVVQGAAERALTDAGCTVTALDKRLGWR